MKYIVLACRMTNDATLELPVVFPNNLVHREVADALVPCVQKHFPGKAVTVVSAGEISSTVFGSDMCHGRSDTLNMNSRGAEDDALLMMNDYGANYKYD